MSSQQSSEWLVFRLPLLQTALVADSLLVEWAENTLVLIPELTMLTQFLVHSMFNHE